MDSQRIGDPVSGRGTVRSVDDVKPDAAGAVDLGALKAALDLGDLASVEAARANLGLGNVATRNVGTASGTVAAGDDSRITGAAQTAQNLADLADAATARTNLSLGDAATRNVGTASGTVADGNDSRIVGAAQKASNLGDLVDAAAARHNLGLAAVAASGKFTDLTGRVVDITDWDDATTPGVLYVGGGAANAPGANGYSGIVVGNAGGAITQIVWRMSGTTTLVEQWQRLSNGSTWGSWVRTDPEPGPWQDLPLANGWVARPNYSSPVFRVMSGGHDIMVTGQLQDGTSSNGTHVFELGAEYAPSGTFTFPILNTLPSSPSHIPTMSVNPDGSGRIYYCSASLIQFTLVFPRD